MSLGKRKLFIFGSSAIGVNMLNLVVGAYICDAVLKSGLVADVANRTYLNRDIVIGSVWAIVITVAKIIDGVIDIPMANFLDNMKAKIGRRKAGILMGFIPMAVSFLLLLVPAFGDNLGLNTIWFGLFLILFYIAYTCVMLAYYACFSEITQDDSERQFLSNVKSVVDVVSFVLNFALIPVLIGFINIRIISLMVFPLSLLIFLSFLMLKGKGTQADDPEDQPVSLGKSFAYACKNKAFMLWMIVFSIMTFGIQMFLSGQDVYFSGVSHFGGATVALVNSCAFGPVPLTIMLYNRVVKKKGFRFGFLYALLTFTVGMAVSSLVNVNIIPDDGTRLIVAMVGALICSLGIGTFFSVSYIIPSHIAAKEKEEKGYSQPSMYFAIQGLFGAGAAAISTGLVWINLRETGNTYLLMGITGVVLLLSCLSTIILPKSIAMIGKKSTSPKG